MFTTFATSPACACQIIAAAHRVCVFPHRKGLRPTGIVIGRIASEMLVCRWRARAMGKLECLWDIEHTIAASSEDSCMLPFQALRNCSNKQEAQR